MTQKFQAWVTRKEEMPIIKPEDTKARTSLEQNQDYDSNV